MENTEAIITENIAPENESTETVYVDTVDTENAASVDVAIEEVGTEEANAVNPESENNPTKPVKKTYKRKRPNDFPAFTENFNALVRRSGKNLQQIAEETGIRGPSLSRYKTGARFYPETKEVATLAVYFNVSIDYLLGVNHADETVNKMLCSPEAMEIAACFDMATKDDKMVVRAALHKYKDMVRSK